jgi:hypothetical protein
LQHRAVGGYEESAAIVHSITGTVYPLRQGAETA